MRIFSQRAPFLGGSHSAGRQGPGRPSDLLPSHPCLFPVLLILHSKLPLTWAACDQCRGWKRTTLLGSEL